MLNQTSFNEELSLPHHARHVKRARMDDFCAPQFDEEAVERLERDKEFISADEYYARQYEILLKNPTTIPYEFLNMYS